jgi:hypothetical protein
MVDNEQEKPPIRPEPQGPPEEAPPSRPEPQDDPVPDPPPDFGTPVGPGKGP